MASFTIERRQQKCGVSEPVSSYSVPLAARDRRIMQPREHGDAVVGEEIQSNQVSSFLS